VGGEDRAQLGVVRIRVAVDLHRGELAAELAGHLRRQRPGQLVGVELGPDARRVRHLVGGGAAQLVAGEQGGELGGALAHRRPRRRSPAASPRPASSPAPPPSSPPSPSPPPSPPDIRIATERAWAESPSTSASAAMSRQASSSCSRSQRMTETCLTKS